MTQAMQGTTPEIVKGPDLIGAFQKGFELEGFIFDQHLVVNEAERASVEAVTGIEAVEAIPEEEFARLGSQSLAAHIEKAKLRTSQRELRELDESIEEQVTGRKIEVISISDDLKPIRQFFRNMQTGKLNPSEGIFGLTGVPPFTSRVSPGKVKGTIISSRPSSNRILIKPRSFTGHAVVGDRWQALMVGEGGVPLVEVNFLD